MPFRPRVVRRRPLMRAAVVGGVGYAAGKKRAKGQQRMDEVEAEAQQAQEMASQTYSTQPSQAQATGSPLDSGRIEKLKELGSLRDSGVLTEEEFQLEKKRILGEA